MTQHVQTRAKLKETLEVTTFIDLINRCMLTPDERELMRLHYIEDKDFRYVGDRLGFAEVTIKEKHRKILKKIDKLL